MNKGQEKVKSLMRKRTTVPPFYGLPSLEGKKKKKRKNSPAPGLPSCRKTKRGLFLQPAETRMLRSPRILGAHDQQRVLGALGAVSFIVPSLLSCVLSSNHAKPSSLLKNKTGLDLF